MGISLGVESLGYGMYTYSALHSNAKLFSKVAPFDPFPHMTCVNSQPYPLQYLMLSYFLFFVIQIAINKIFYYKCYQSCTFQIKKIVIKWQSRKN